MKIFFVFIATMFALTPYAQSDLDYDKKMFKQRFYEDVDKCISYLDYKGYKPSYTDLCLKKAIIDAKEHSLYGDKFPSEEKARLMKEVLEDINKVHKSLSRQI